MKMKTIITHLCGLLLVVGMFVAGNTFAQNTPNPPNTLSQEEKRFDLNGDGQLSGEEQDIMIQAITTDAFTGQAVSFGVSGIGAKFEGTLSTDGREISGTWTQGGQSMPLTFRRAG